MANETSYENYKTLILNKNEFKTYGNGWKYVSSTLPKQEVFDEEGINDLSILDRQAQTVETIKENTYEDKEDGKVFRMKINLDKYFDLRKLEIK